MFGVSAYKTYDNQGVEVASDTGTTKTTAHIHIILHLVELLMLTLSN